MTYNPAVPTGLVRLDQDYLNIQANFNVLNTYYNTDHSALTQNVVTNGYHLDIHQKPRSGDPANNANASTLYTRADVGNNLFYKSITGNAVTQLTGLANSLVSPGYFTLPGGLIIQWGTVTAPPATGTVSFPLNPFPSGLAPFTIQLQSLGVASTPPVILSSSPAPTATGFTYRYSTLVIVNPPTYLYWVAIGY